MQFSIVIPAFNMASRLKQGLLHLAQLPVPADCALEVIVVDDGSSDLTAEVLREARAGMPHLRHIYRGRDALSCRSRARNLGLDACQGDFVIFIDAGVLVTSNFLQATLDALTGADSVLVYQTLGLYAGFAGHDESRHAELTGPAVDAVCLSVGREEAWQDVRTPYFDAVGGRLSAWPAPWLFAWTCALGVRKDAARAVGGFDDGFIDWGAEDIEFAGRLHRAGASFLAVSEACALHLPHRTASVAEMHRQHVANSRKMHARLRCRESEAYLRTQDAFSVNQICHRLDALDGRMLVPRWSEKGWAACRELIAAHEAVLCLGFADLAEVTAPGPGVVLAHNRSSQARFARQCPRSEVRCALGMHTLDAPGTYDAVLIGDMIRLLPSEWRTAIFAEAARVGASSHLLLGKRPARSLHVEACGFQWAAASELIADAQRAGLGVHSERNSAGLSLFELRAEGACASAREAAPVAPNADGEAAE